jgi:hypothetical protein
MLQSKAGYIDARPHIRQLDQSSLATHGRTIHSGHPRHIGALSTLAPAMQEESDVSAKRSGAAMYPAFECSRYGRRP